MIKRTWCVARTLRGAEENTRDEPDPRAPIGAVSPSGVSRRVGAGRRGDARARLDGQGRRERDRAAGQVQSESATEVVVKLGNNLINVPADQVVSVRYDGQPANMVLAETREAAGQLAEAADLYKKAIDLAESHPLIAQAARFKQAELTADIASWPTPARPPRLWRCSMPS